MLFLHLYFRGSGISCTLDRAIDILGETTVPDYLNKAYFLGGGGRGNNVNSRATVGRTTSLVK